MATEDVKAQLEENAKAPQSIETDGMVVREHNLKDQIEAHRYLSKTANNTGMLPIRIGKIKPGSAAR